MFLILCCVVGNLRLQVLLRTPLPVTLFPPCCYLQPKEGKEFTGQKPSALAWHRGDLIFAPPFLRVEFWALRLAGCAIWTRPGTSASPNIPSLGWMEFLRKAVFPLATTSGKPHYLSRSRCHRYPQRRSSQAEVHKWKGIPHFLLLMLTRLQFHSGRTSRQPFLVGGLCYEVWIRVFKMDPTKKSAEAGH